MILKEIYSFIKNKYELSEPDARALIEFQLQKDFSLIIGSQEEISKRDLSLLEKEAYSLQQGYPLSYILNEHFFYKHKFYVDNNVLIPRTETEYLVELVIKDLKNQGRTPQLIMDIGAGSGCIGISLLLEYPQSKVFFVEDSPGAVAVTLRNLRNHQIDETRSAISSSLIEAQNLLAGQKLDLIVSNPPYIASEDQRVDDNVKLYEPPHALYADDDGYAYLKGWSIWSKNNIKAKGTIYFEFGEGQAGELGTYAEAQGWTYKILRDQFQVDRFWHLDEGV